MKNRGHWTGVERTPIGAWERALRPNGSSLWLLVLLLIAAGVFLALAVWSALQDAQQGAPGLQVMQVSTQPQTQPQPIPTAVSAPQQGSEANGSVDPAMSTGPQPRAQQISKCTSRNGSATYSDGPCPAGTFTSVMTVRPDTNIVDGMTREAREASIGSNATVAQGAAQRERQVASNGQGQGQGQGLDSGGSRAAECGRLSTSIAAIDAAARQPRSGYEQDRLKAERLQLRDRHFALRCI
ncbi:hypothetical protein ACSFA3_03000 [Variovorax sp. RHLX14]|uniref:hypothetical protein n=1 Tax=Variovorax sp. RHLX14 TaxID=1259731 RepID=UPI003F485117